MGKLGGSPLSGISCVYVHARLLLALAGPSLAALSFLPANKDIFWHTGGRSAHASILFFLEHVS